MIKKILAILGSLFIFTTVYAGVKTDSINLNGTLINGTTNALQSTDISDFGAAVSNLIPSATVVDQKGGSILNWGINGSGYAITTKTNLYYYEDYLPFDDADTQRSIDWYRLDMRAGSDTNIVFEWRGYGDVTGDVAFVIDVATNIAADYSTYTTSVYNTEGNFHTNDFFQYTLSLDQSTNTARSIILRWAVLGSNDLSTLIRTTNFNVGSCWIRYEVN